MLPIGQFRTSLTVTNMVMPGAGTWEVGMCQVNPSSATGYYMGVIGYVMVVN